MTATELITVPLVAGSKIGDPSNHASATLKESLDTLSKVDGMHQVHFGMQEEDPNILRFLVTWESVDVHNQFRSTSTHDTFLKKISTIFSAEPYFYHVDFSVNPKGLNKALSAPVTEVAVFSFEGGPPSDYIKGATETLDTWSRAPEAEEHGFLAYSLGTTIEELEKDGVKGKGAVLIIGWESVEQHMTFRELDLFKDNVKGIRNGAKSIDMKHTVFMDFVAS